MIERPQSPFLARSKLSGTLIAVGSLVIYLIVRQFAGDGRGTMAGESAGTLALLIWVSWPLRKEVWFWVAAAALASLHLFAVMFFDWSEAAKWTGLTLMPVMWADIAAMLAIIYVLYRAIYGAPAEMVAEEPNNDRYSERDISL